MRATRLYFERTKSENFNNRKCGIEIALEKGESAKDALKKAEVFVATALNEDATVQQMNMALKSRRKSKVDDSLPF